MSKNNKNANADILTGEPGSHPIGTGIGTVAAASVGALIGTAAGPAGTVSGAVIGAVVGGILGAKTGKDIAEDINPTQAGLEAKWLKHHSGSIYGKSHSYESFRNAYQYGHNARVSAPKKQFHEVESDLITGWNSNSGTNLLEWERVREAVQHAYENQPASEKAKH